MSTDFGNGEPSHLAPSTRQPADGKKPAVFLPLVGLVPAKYIALILLVAQTVGVVSMMRYSRIVQKAKQSLSLGSLEVTGAELYLNTTAVFFSELFKLVGSFFLVLYEHGGHVGVAVRLSYAAILKQPLETIKVGIPAVLYTIQNNLIFIALSHISAATYQVTYQLKILTTALLSVMILKKDLPFQKWAALVCLTVGVAVTEWPSASKSAVITPDPLTNAVLHTQSEWKGISAVLLACVTSGFSGVYFEKVLKNTPVSIWLRNIQLALFGTLLSLVGVYWRDAEAVRKNGFLQGYTWIVWVVIALQGLGGLIVAAVLKYADNILKCFANAVALIMSFCVGIFILRDAEPTIMFLIGIILIIFASFVYTVDDINFIQR